MPTRPAGDRRALGEAGVPLQVVLGILCPAGMAVLFWQYLDVYLTFFGVAAEATGQDEVRYTITAIATVSIAVAGVVVALARRRFWASVLALVVLALVLVTAAVFGVPRGRWDPVEPRRPLPADYQPCYSGSNDCVGG